jgi:hypothetical protein
MFTKERGGTGLNLRMVTEWTENLLPESVLKYGVKISGVENRPDKNLSVRLPDGACTRTNSNTPADPTIPYPSRSSVLI